MVKVKDHKQWGYCIVENDVHIAMYSAIIAKDRIQEICILVMSSTGGGGLGCAVDKAVWQDLTAIAKLEHGWVRVVMSKLGFAHFCDRRSTDVLVWESCIRPQSYMAVALMLWLM